MKKKTKNLPVVPMRGVIVFPYITLNFDATRPLSVNAITAANDADGEMLLVSQRDIEVADPDENDIFSIGTVVRIRQLMHMPGGMTRVVAEGICRARLGSVYWEDSYMRADAEEIKDVSSGETALDNAYERTLKEVFKKYFSQCAKLNSETFIHIMAIQDLSMLSDVIASKINMRFEARQELLEEFNVYRRIEKLIGIINNQIQILRLEKDISARVQKNIDKNQREYYLREQLKVIRNELGDRDGVEQETAEYTEKIEKLKAPRETKEKLLKEVDHFSKMPPNSSDSALLRNYLDTVLSLPWSKITKERFDIAFCRRELDKDHYGLEKVKERVLEYLAVRRLTDGKAGTILCLAGPPGVGKTSIAKSIARVLNRKYVRISLGGIHDEADIRGHRKTYIGAMEGRIMSAMLEAKVKNPLILLDEIDKMGTDYRGDPAAALLEVLDNEQNMAFRDHYIEVPFDLSKVLFVTTANTLDGISRPLLDRMEIIELTGYTEEEKFHIAKKYLVKKAIGQNGLDRKRFSINDEALRECISGYTREAGVRRLEQQIGAICRKAACMLLENGGEKIRVTKRNLHDFLGRKRYFYDPMSERDQVGIARGLAWTAVGGDTLSIETNVVDGSGKVQLTGKLGDVMKESAMAAISYIRSRSDELNIEPDFQSKKDIHIHVPEGAVPKDGPSAGITMATALASSLTERPVRRDVAMTGEITLRGRVLPIGGLKEKSLAAYRAGIHTIIIPDENKADLEDIPSDVRDKINFIPVKNMDDVLKNALI